MLLPIVPPSAAPSVTPGTLRTALCSDVTPCDCISGRLMITIDCGRSCTLSPSRLRLGAGGAKSPLGLAPVTLIGDMVAVGKGLGEAGWAEFGWSAGVGLGDGCGGVACWAIATGAPTNSPIIAVFTGTRRTGSPKGSAND